MSGYYYWSEQARSRPTPQGRSYAQGQADRLWADDATWESRPDWARRQGRSEDPRYYEAGWKGCGVCEV